jgi:hypothetical protein
MAEAFLKNLENEDAIRDVVQKFEACQYAPEEFTHAHHLTVACWYLCTLDRPEAFVRMRSGLKRFIAHYGKQGYHETITRFWMELLAAYLEDLPAEMSLVSKVNFAVERYGSKQILFSYYTRERVMSDAAKQDWIAPDLQSIGGSQNILPADKVEI